jgi:hypothetical protein
MDELQAQLAARDELQQKLAEVQQALGRETYRLDTLEVRFDLTQEEIRALESLTPAGILASISGTKAGKLDAFREECRKLENEHRECVQAVEVLTQQVAQITGELAGFEEVQAEYQALCTTEAPVEQNDIRLLDRAIDAAESLVSHVTGSYKITNRLRSGPTLLQCGAILRTATQAWGGKLAGDVTGQIAGSVSHFCEQVRQLGLNLGIDSDREILAACSQLERFTDPSSLGAGAEADAWAELEAVARGVLSDLQERRSRLNPDRA